MSDCCPSNGSSWDTPIPGPTIIVPQGSQVIAEPTAYGGGCGCGSGVAVSGVSGGTVVSSPTSIHPALKTTVEIPAIGSNFQITSTGASLWAIAGMLVWFPPFGYAEITGVTGDLLTLKNLTITLGTVLSAGSNFIATLPPQPVPAVVAPVLKQFIKSNSRPNLYSQSRSGGAPWSTESVTRDLSTYSGFDATYKAAALSFKFEGYSGSRAFDMFLKINGIERDRRSLPPNTTSFNTSSLLIPLDSPLLLIETGETLVTAGTVGSLQLNVWLEGFIP